MSEVAQVPQLRFPEFSGEWEDGKLGNYGNLINGLTYSPDNIVDDGLLVLRSSNVQNGQIYLNDNVYVNLDVDDAALTREDDILICVRNGSKRLIGKSTIINKNLPKSTHGAFMTVFRGESNKFISHWFHSSIYYKEVHKNLGATINSINGSNLKKFKTIFPAKSEQQKIASFLTAVDTKIEQLSKKQALLGEYKKGLTQQIFSQAIRFKADDGSDFPDWKEKKLENVLKRTSTGLNPRQNFKLGYGENYYVTIKNISNGKLDFSKCERIDENAMTMIANRSDLSKGDLIMSSIGNVGESYLLDKEPENWNINESVFMLRASELMLPQFLYFIITNEQSKWYLESNSTGSSFKSIKLGELKLLPLGLPSLEEQTKIANFLSSIDTKIEQVGKQLDESKQFKKALLQQMFV